MKIFQKFSLVIQSTLCLLVLFFSFIPFHVQADTVKIDDDCTVTWTVGKTSTSQQYTKQFTIDRNHLRYVGKAVFIGDCSDYYGQYTYYAYESPTSTTPSASDKFACDLLTPDYSPYTVNINFTELVKSYRKFDLDYRVYKKTESGCNGGGVETDPEVVALSPEPGDDGGGGGGGGSGGDPNTPPGSGESTIRACVGSDGKPIKGKDGNPVKIDLSKGEKCPGGTLACIKPDGTTVSPAADGTCPQSQSSGVLFNPIKSDSLIHLAFSLLRAFLGGAAALAVVFIVLGGFRLVVSRGNPEAVTRGKDIIIWSLVGLLVALMAFSLTAVVQNLLGAF